MEIWLNIGLSRRGLVATIQSCCLEHKKSDERKIWLCTNIDQTPDRNTSLPDPNLIYIPLSPIFPDPNTKIHDLNDTHTCSRSHNTNFFVNHMSHNLTTTNDTFLNYLNLSHTQQVPNHNASLFSAPASQQDQHVRHHECFPWRSS